MQQFTLGNLIGEGRYRRCFAVNEHPDLCAKTIKPTIEKQYFGRLKVTYPTRYYLLLQFGIADLNKLEWENVASLPQEMRMYAPPIVDLANNGDETGETMFVSSRAFDYDGTPSKTLLEHGPTSNAEFWKHIEKIADCMLDSRKLFFDIFNMGQNIVIQKCSASESRPLLIDVKRSGKRMYPFQLHLFLPSEQRKKFSRRFQAFRERFEDEEREAPSETFPHMLGQFDEAV